MNYELLLRLILKRYGPQTFDLHDIARQGIEYKLVTTQDCTGTIYIKLVAPIDEMKKVSNAESVVPRS